MKRTCICGVEIKGRLYKQHYGTKRHILKVGDRVNDWHKLSDFNEDGRVYTKDELYEMSNKILPVDFFENFYDKCSKKRSWVKKCRYCGIENENGKIFFGDATSCRICKTHKNKLDLETSPKKREKLRKYYRDRWIKQKELNIALYE